MAAVVAGKLALTNLSDGRMCETPLAACSVWAHLGKLHVVGPTQVMRMRVYDHDAMLLAAVEASLLATPVRSLQAFQGGCFQRLFDVTRATLFER